MSPKSFEMVSVRRRTRLTRANHPLLEKFFQVGIVLHIHVSESLDVVSYSFKVNLCFLHLLYQPLLSSPFDCQHSTAVQYRYYCATVPVRQFPAV